MASIPKMLMDEFYAENRKALKEKNFDRALIMSSGESLVNNYLHGNPPALTLTLTKNALNSIRLDEATASDEEKQAITDAVLMVEIFAEQYGLTLGDENTQRPL